MILSLLLRRRPQLRRDSRLVLRQAYYEQIGFWRNRYGAVFTVGFSVIFLLLMALSGNAHRRTFYGVPAINYYVAAFAAYGVMSACFNTLAISLVVRRETGILKRLRLSPLPTPVFFGALLVNSVAISVLEVVMLLLIGRLGFQVPLPANLGAFAVALLIGSASFTALGVATSSIVPNEQAAGPIVSVVYFVLLYLSGLWFPIKAGSGLARFSGWFPIRHLILAMFAPFRFTGRGSPWAWHDLLVVAIWGVAATIFALRRFGWEPRRK